jgi:hypothetical protein
VSRDDGSSKVLSEGLERHCGRLSLFGQLPLHGQSGLGTDQLPWLEGLVTMN